MILWMIHQRALKLLKRLHVILMTIFPCSILHKIYSTKVNALFVLNLITWWFSRTLGTIHNLLLFARQNKVKFLMCTYKDTTSSPHSYLMLDWNQTLRKSFQCEATFWEIHKMYRYIIYSKRKRIICNLTMVLPACLKTLRRICRIWRILIVLPSSSKAKKKELLNI